MPHNRWYNEDCKNYIDNLKYHDLVVLLPQDMLSAHKEIHKMTHHKKRAWGASQHWELYHMLISSDCVVVTWCVK